MSLSCFTPESLFDLSEFEHAGLFKDCQYVWQVLSKITSYFPSFSFHRQNGIIDSGAHLVNPDVISIGKGTIVEPGAYIQGPCIIGENCQIRCGTYIRGNVIIGNSCVIRSELKNSLLLNHANAAHYNYLGDSILGNYVNLGAGAICANLRLDRKEIAVRLNEKKIMSGLRKFGAILGDNTQVGCNTVLLPGTITGKNVFFHPLMTIGGVIEANSIKSKNE